MSEFKQQYKNPRPGFGHVDHSRILRAYKHVESRKLVRTQAFHDNRNLQDVLVASPQSAEDVPILNAHTKKFLKWKEERNKRKKLENAKKKPAFKVGIVHHALCSPAIRTNTPTVVAKTSKQTTHSNDVQKRITKATEKRLLAKAAKQSAKHSAATTKNVALTSTKHPMNIKKPTSNTKKQKSFAPANYEFRPPSGLHKMPLFGLVPIEQTPQEKGDFFIQDKSTECKTIAINEQKDISSQKLYSEIPDTSGITTKFKTYANPKLLPNKRKSSQSLNESICVLNDVTFESNRIVTTRSSSKEQTIQDSLQNKSLDNTNIKTPSQKSTPSDTSSGKEYYVTEKNYITENVECNYHYKLLWYKETNRLKELCRKWVDRIKLEKDIPYDAMYEIHQAVRQTILLINKKFDRFRRLVEDCKIGRKRNWNGEKIVTCSYLQGFWDMAYMEVRNCDSRFEKLEQSRKRGWKEENLTAFRRKKMESKILNEEDMLLQDTNINVKDSTSPQNNRGSVIFDNNTDTQCSTRKSNSHDLTYKRKSTSTRRESSETSLVQEVQFSNKKEIKSPYVSSKLSQMYKTSDVQLDDKMSYINSDQTPDKSILKKSEELVGKEIRVKSAHKVHFDDQVALNEVPLDEEMQTKLNCSAALSRIENLDLYELNPQEYINAERKLDFETEDFDSSDDVNEFSAQIQKLKDKPNESKLSVQNIDSNARSFNDTTFSISDKESSPGDLKIISRKEFNIPINILPATPLQTNTETSITSETISNMTDMENHDSGIRILRSRTIMTNNTSKNNSKMMTPRTKKRNKTPLKSSKKNLLKSSQKDVNKYMTPNKGNIREMENTILIENVDKKRSSRKRKFAFSEACVACAENKPVLPISQQK